MRFQWLQVLRLLGLEFWLPLPLLGLAFWAGGSWLTAQRLNRVDATMPVEIPAEVKQATPAQSPDQTLTIKVDIDQQRGVSWVKVVSISRSLQTQKFQVASTVPDQIEAAISRELQLPTGQVKQFVRYQLMDAGRLP
jgi:hypothetical protein